MASNELFGKANEEFVNENYQKALELYTEAIKTNDAVDDYYSNRAQVHLKLDNYESAISDANKACELNPKNSKAFFRKGIALFHLQKYKEAKETFLDSQILEGENSNNKLWIRKCDAELDLSSQNPVETSEPKVGVSTGEQSTNSKSNANDSQSESTSLSPPNQTPAVSSQQKIKHDWYQTQTHVVVTVLLKNVKKENMQSEIQEKSLSVSVKLPQGSEYNLEIDLPHNVVPEKSTTKVLSSKIEIKLKKTEERQWTKLEDDGEKQTNIKQFKPEAEDSAKNYPTSSHYTRNWDKLVDDIKQEEKDEKLEGDAALNQLFQKIYADGTDETKKAMMKSFYESGGTVLSTNWKEVGDEKVDVKPPDGMEYKKWEY